MEGKDGVKKRGENSPSKATRFHDGLDAVKDQER